MGPTHRGSPAQGQGRLLPRASQAAAAVASMPATPGHLLLPPRHISTPGDAQELPRSIPPLHGHSPRLPRRFRRRPRAHRSAPPWKPVATFLLSRCHLVQDARRHRLHRRVQAIEARSPEHVVLFAEPPLNPQELVVDSAAAAAPPASSSPSLQPG